jgi:outer membrane protein OmpA-like peptidoglycan-associated protein
MTDIDELPSWAGRALKDQEAAEAAQPPPEPGSHGRRTGLLLTVVGIAIIAALGLAVLFVTRTGDEALDTQDQTSTTGSNETAGTTAEGGTATETEVASPTTSTTQGTTTSSAQGIAGDDAAGPEESGAAGDGPTSDATNADGSIRHAVFEGGKVYLRGRVPSEEISTTIETRAAAVVGPENVVNEYEIDPSVPVSVAAPLYVEDVVLFGFNSIYIEPAFLPILDLGTLLLVQNPNVTITVVTRTDAIGSEASNLEVARLRAQAVINYWLGKGIDASRLIADPRGEEGASEDDDAETAARRRRAEFIISGLLD